MTKTISGIEMRDRLLKNIDNPRITEQENKYFTLYRKKVQRKTGGCKNKWIIRVKAIQLLREQGVLTEALGILESLGGTDFGGTSRVFRRYEDAEKAWIYITLRWS
jgi:hypothetical protein